MTFLRRSRKDDPKYIDLSSASPSEKAKADREAQVKQKIKELGDKYLLATPIEKKVQTQ